MMMRFTVAALLLGACGAIGTEAADGETFAQRLRECSVPCRNLFLA
jgi:hypothetical protein